MNKLGLSSNFVCIKTFYAFGSFWFWRSKIGHTFREINTFKIKFTKFVKNKCRAFFCIFFDEKEVRRGLSIFDIEIRIAMILTFKTKRNHRPIIFYTHKVGPEAKLIHSWTQLSSACYRRSYYCTILSKWHKRKIIRRSSSRLQCWCTPYTMHIL